MNETNAALITGRSETYHVPDYPASERDQRGCSVETVLHQGIEDLLDSLEILVLFAIRKDQRAHVEIIEIARDRIEIKRCDGFVRDHHDLRGLDVSGKKLFLIEQIRAYMNRVAAIAQINV